LKKRAAHSHLSSRTPAADRCADVDGALIRRDQ
jgi:hypothetical protein